MTISPQKDSYDPGEVVTITAVPSPGYIMGSWGGDGAGTAISIEATMDTDKYVTVSFVRHGLLITNESHINNVVTLTASYYDNGVPVPGKKLKFHDRYYITAKKRGGLLSERT